VDIILNDTQEEPPTDFSCTRKQLTSSLPKAYCRSTIYFNCSKSICVGYAPFFIVDNQEEPCCGEPEDAPHVWTCKGVGVKELWDKSMTDLKGWLSKMDTDPDVQYTILSYLRSWRDNTRPTSLPNYLVQKLQEKQTMIGWRRFFEGWIAKDWTHAQKKFYDTVKSYKTGKRWTIALIKKMPEIAWDLWTHQNGILHEKDKVVLRSKIQ
jgi:hypothetical protein